ncbi:4-hydroxythreonine-4-phosphate dehydrogenase PdxA [Coraliomargarita sinensis]|uniref:4-hydroxythreonine-4-phosphate dehydrogenase PdxA n=1 Tax=Coraliomargarita sinensis TaxID=2174842 RepID=A0A317ZM26_9BACT|nr:4-hydroxythreonine-4-phosphate dehydrogenase PdxA [Coraliomargarita sinensis]PXA04441.1 4-hydroxythreonine-4-phosphate dehydrogenase PdxA [Coraliomargarita sinensis]
MSAPLDKLPIAITCGDPAGVGPDVIESALNKDASLATEAVVIGPAHWLEDLHARTGVRTLPVGEASFDMKPGLPSVEGAALALEAMGAAAQGCQAGRYRGVVTGPVNKHWLNQTGFSFLGQTEFFAEAWGGEPTMAFVGEKLKVVLATWHMSLREVPDALDAACLEKAVARAYDLAKLYGVAEPRIGVCGLNPHAGEQGLLGNEEIEVMNPALDRLRENMPGLSSCLPGDTVFYRQLRGDFDVVVAAYHDQGLAALKTLEFDRAVNVTLGLPFVRTSPDHGTAFELAGQGRADVGSFAAAVRVLRELTA